MGDLTPPFEEPAGAEDNDSDEAVDDAAGAELPDPFNLNTWMSEGELLLGWVGTLQYIQANGDIEVCHAQVFVDDYAALGMHQRAMRELNERLDMNAYTFSEEDD